MSTSHTSEPFPAAQPPERLLLGPGPSPVHERVTAAQARSLVGHLDPWFLEVTDQVAAMLRAVFRTENPLTYAVSGTGSAGMETAVVNVVAPGDTVIVGINGVFGGRIADTAERAGADVVRVEEPWGRIIPTDRFATALDAHPGARLVAVVHAETSTGAHQPLEELGALLRDTDTLLLVDTVTGLGGVPLEVDAWGLDVVYSGTQKCLSVPPGLAPITFSAKAEEVLDQRRAPVRSWYLDVSAIRRYWGMPAAGGSGERAYHHTAPISALLGLHEGLRMVLEEGLETRWARHAEVGELFQSHLLDRDATLLAQEGHRLPQLTSFAWPEGVDEGVLRRRLLTEHGIEVGGGLGTFAGTAWRVGLMGEGATHANVDRLLDAMDELRET
ncbi:pyridoxal-phosphate-dependent aminotransferase family protein [Nitriliruptor alkaliphilus]|uniref:pyridoxal-phosphate-dependent aminotransferase family protein n=1 Tax=Nitriliruptor alkaliphilus TaxID=427918 RepID=UPI000AA30A47|nr:alanine--glyoxylate aminotransferase family protein [Nitriliruptor alkaliphilus]